MDHKSNHLLNTVAPHSTWVVEGTLFKENLDKGSWNSPACQFWFQGHMFGSIFSITEGTLRGSSCPWSTSSQVIVTNSNKTELVLQILKHLFSLLFQSRSASFPLSVSSSLLFSFFCTQVIKKSFQIRESIKLNEKAHYIQNGILLHQRLHCISVIYFSFQLQRLNFFLI